MLGASPPASQTSGRQILLIAGIVAVALLVRLPHIGWGLPGIEEEAFPHKKALQMWGWADGRLTLDPETAGWPSLSFYLHLALQQLHYLAGRISGAFGDRYDYYLLATEQTSVVVLARLLGVIAAVVVVLAGARIASRLAGTAGLFLVGSCLALSPFLVEYSQLITPDILLAGFAALALVKILDAHQHGRTRDYLLSGLWIGLGTSCKYTPLLLAPVLYLGHLLRLRAETGSARWLGLADRRLAIAAGACVMAFVATSPFLVIHLAVLKRDVLFQAEHLSGGHLGHTHDGPAYLFYLRSILQPALGWPALILASGGLAYQGVRRRGAWLLLAVSALLFFLVLGLLRTQFDRYLLPMLLPLATGLAGFYQLLRSRLPAGTRTSGVLLLAMAALTLVPTARGTWHYHRSGHQSSSLELARQYLVRELGPADPLILMESYCPELRSRDLPSSPPDPLLERLSPVQRRQWSARPTFSVTYLPFYVTRSELNAYYYELRHFLAYDLVVTSSAVRNRYKNDPGRFGRHIAFYDDLDRYAHLIRVFSPRPGQRGPELKIYRFTEAGKDSLLAARGPLPPDTYQEFLEQLHAPHFFSFADRVAIHSLQKGRYRTADRLFQALYDTYPADRRNAVLPRLAETKARTGQLEQARRLGETLLANQPANLAAHSFLGMVNEEMGDLDRARYHFQRTVDLAPDSGGEDAAVRWAREKLESLPVPDAADGQ